jgi:hypothetical protein
VVSDFVRAAIARGQEYRSSLFADAVRVFADYDGPEISGDPAGTLPKDLEDNDL